MGLVALDLVDRSMNAADSVAGCKMCLKADTFPPKRKPGRLNGAKRRMWTILSTIIRQVADKVTPVSLIYQ